MSAWRPIVLAGTAAAGGAAVTLGVGALLGMPGGELAHLGVLLLLAVAVTALSALAARRLLVRAPERQRLLAIAFVSSAVGVANLAALARLMFVSDHDTTQIAVLVTYSLAAGGGVALALSRSSAGGLERLAETARRLGDGDLDARVGAVGAGPELDELGTTLDEMALRLQGSLQRERTGEAQRRDLITAVSHDLRTPLAGLRAMVEAIDDGIVDDGPTVRRYVAEMRGAIDSLVAMVDELFELVRIDAGAIAAEEERVRLADAIGSAISACDGQATRKGLAVETEFNGTGGTPCSPRVSRVVQNLLQNAIRHTPADGAVRVEAVRSVGGLEVIVEDTGEGIAPEELERVFDPFWRGDESRSSNGSGLGLALAKRIVEALGGEIRVRSDPNLGSRFAVSLPSHR